MRRGRRTGRLRQGWGPWPFGPLPLCSRQRQRRRARLPCTFAFSTTADNLAARAARANKLLLLLRCIISISTMIYG